MQTLDNNQVEELLAHADGNVSYQSRYARTTAIIDDTRNNRVKRMSYASDVLSEMREAERKAAYVAPIRPTVSGVRMQLYTGPFPRGKHSHRCKGCEVSGRGMNAVYCYKSKCARPQTTATCTWCARIFDAQ